MMKVLVYTALTCRRDVLRPWEDKPARFVAKCFTDEPEFNAADGWEIQPLFQRKSCPIRTARWHKMKPNIHSPGFDFFVWVDAHFLPKPTLPHLIRKMRKHVIASFPHRSRNDPYAEVEKVQELNLESESGITYAWDQLLKTDYPEDGGLHETGILVMRNCRELRVFLDRWWAELSRHEGRRDQLHFDRVLRECGITAYHPPGNVERNPYFDWGCHLISTESQRLQTEWT